MRLDYMGVLGSILVLPITSYHQGTKLPPLVVRRIKVSVSVWPSLLSLIVFISNIWLCYRLEICAAVHGNCMDKRVASFNVIHILNKMSFLLRCLS